MLRFCRRLLASRRADTASALHFLTWRLAAGQSALGPAERDVVCGVLRERRDPRCRLLAYVVMDNHVHVVARLTRVPPDRVVQAWKSLSAHQLLRAHRRVGPVWHDDSFDHPLRTTEELRRKVEYIVGNPWKRWPFIQGYRWVWEAGEEGRSEK